MVNFGTCRDCGVDLSPNGLEWHFSCQSMFLNLHFKEKRRQCVAWHFEGIKCF